MKERPVLFSGEMVRAILDNHKTQTRRVIKPQPMINFTDKYSVEIEWLGVLTRRSGGLSFSAQELLDYFWEDICNQRLTNEVLCPYGRRGDRLWVRETFCYYHSIKDEHGNQKIAYRADIDPKYHKNFTWKPSIHMPRKASRIFLEVTDIRIERLQDISEEDAIAEGIEKNPVQFDTWLDYPAGSSAAGWRNPKHSFQSLWQSINGNDSWELNPWVWVIEFKQI